MNNNSQYCDLELLGGMHKSDQPFNTTTKDLEQLEVPLFAPSASESKIYTTLHKSLESDQTVLFLGLSLAEMFCYKG